MLQTISIQSQYSCGNRQRLDSALDMLLIYLLEEADDKGESLSDTLGMAPQVGLEKQDAHRQVASEYRITSAIKHHDKVKPTAPISAPAISGRSHSGGASDFRGCSKSASKSPRRKRLPPPDLSS